MDTRRTEMAFSWALLLLLLLVYSVAPNDHQERFLNNLARVAQFKCRVPQPRRMLVGEILSAHLETHEEVAPTQTVLHRCDNESGCCSNNYDCRPDLEQIQNVTLWFKVMDTSNKKAHRHLHHVFQNHTVCHCLERQEDQPK